MLHHLPGRGLAALLAAVVLTLTGCSTLEGTGDAGYVTQNGQVRQVTEANRGEPIELTGEGLDGETLDLADFRGKVTVMNVWGAWCVQCRVEIPDLVEAEERTKDIAHFVGINIRDGSTAQATSFMRKYGFSYPSFYSPDGKALLPFHDTIPPSAIPSTVVLDAEGRVAAAIIGILPSATTLVEVVEDAAGVETSAEDGADADG